jgi:hypothetical protein
MRRTFEEELRKSLEITEEALRRANGEIESLALANQTLAASDRAHMTKIEQLQREVDLYTDILRSICGLLELPHSESGPCDRVGYYTRAIEGLQVATSPRPRPSASSTHRPATRPRPSGGTGSPWMPASSSMSEGTPATR